MLLGDNEYHQAQQAMIKRDGHYIGTLMLVLLVAMELTFTAVVLLLLLFGVIDGSALADDYLGLGNTAYLWIYSAVYTFVFLVPTVVVSLCFKKRPFPPVTHRQLSAVDGFLVVLGMVALCILTSIGVGILMSFLENFGVPMPDLPSLLENTPKSLALNLLVMAVLPSLLEEMLFRGCVLRVLRPYGDWLAILVSAALFGLMHGNIVQIPFALIVGVALGWLYVATDNIWMPIAVHFANNAISVSMEYAMMHLGEKAQALFAVLTYGLVTLIGVIALVMLSAKKSALLRRFDDRCPLPVDQRVKALFSSPPLLIALTAFVILLVVEMLK